MISCSTDRRLVCRQNSPNPENPQSLPDPRPISRRDILVLRELAVSESLPNLEVEPEWCSAAVLSSISAATEPIDMRATEPITLVAIEPATEPLAANATPSEETPKSDPVPAKPARSTTKLRSEIKTSRTKKSPQSTRTMRLVEAMRSRRVRIVATVVSVLFVCGLIVMNWKSGSSSTSDEVAEMDLSEFNDASGLDEPRIGNMSEPQPLGVISDAESISGTDRFPQRESGPRLPPLGLVTHADHAASRGQAAGELVPASASSSGPRGAVLTGQIEFETTSRSSEAPARPFRSLGMR